MGFLHLFQRNEVKVDANKLNQAARDVGIGFSKLIKPGTDFDRAAKEIRVANKDMQKIFSKLINDEVEHLIKKAKEERDADPEMTLRDIESENMALFKTFIDFSNWIKRHSR